MITFPTNFSNIYFLRVSIDIHALWKDDSFCFVLFSQNITQAMINLFLVVDGIDSVKS